MVDSNILILHVVPSKGVESCIWESMRLLRGIPSEVICHIADRLGAGLLTFVK